jgi:GxxExxY protein
MTQIRDGSHQDRRDGQTYAIIGAAMEVHRILGCSFLEPVYQAALQVEFGVIGVPYVREVELPIQYKGTPLGVRYKADFLCYGAVLVELKALDRISAKEDGQIINYLAASRLERGLLLNFGSPSLQYKRFVGLNSGSLSSVKSVQSVGNHL